VVEDGFGVEERRAMRPGNGIVGSGGQGRGLAAQTLPFSLATYTLFRGDYTPAQHTTRATDFLYYGHQQRPWLVSFVFFSRAVHISLRDKECWTRPK